MLSAGLRNCTACFCLLGSRHLRLLAYTFTRLQRRHSSQRASERAPFAIKPPRLPRQKTHRGCKCRAFLFEGAVRGPLFISTFKYTELPPGITEAPARRASRGTCPRARHVRDFAKSSRPVVK